MNVDVVEAVRASSDNLKNAILRSVTVDGKIRKAEVNLITDCTFTDADVQSAARALKPFVPGYFSCAVTIS